MKKRLIVTFANTPAAIMAEQALKPNDKDGKISPLPDEISGSCGLVWDSNPDKWQEIKDILDENEIQWEEKHIIG